MPKKGVVKIKKTCDLSAYGFNFDGDTIDLADLGISLSDTALSNLLAPPPNKEYVTNKSRNEHGSRILTQNARMDERSINLPFHLLASSQTQFYARYRALCAILATGELELWYKYAPDISFRLRYVSCSSFTTSNVYRTTGKKAALFNLRVVEPDPSDREVNKALFPYFKLDVDNLDNDNNRLI